MFQLRTEHEDAFQAVAEDNFLERAAAHLRENFPDQTAALSQSEIRTRVRDGRTRARGYGFETERDVIRFIDAQFLLGDEFDRNPRHQWAKEYLDVDGAAPEDRALALIEKAEELVRSPAGHKKDAR
jgi:hypothetical protein